MFPGIDCAGIGPLREAVRNREGAGEDGSGCLKRIGDCHAKRRSHVEDGEGRCNVPAAAVADQVDGGCCLEEDVEFVLNSDLGFDEGEGEGDGVEGGLAKLCTLGAASFGFKEGAHGADVEKI